MSTQTIPQARAFVADAELPPPPPVTLGPSIASTPFTFDTVKEQAAVVGSDVIAFVKGLSTAQRQDLVNASLLAQLVATKQFPEPTSLDEVLQWYDTYFDVLSNIGFVIQDKGFAEYEEKSASFEAHEAILDVAAVVLAGSPGALAIVRKTLESLKKMSADSPWITIFNRESRSATTARFQVSLAEPGEDDGLLVTIVAFGVDAKATMTQVLFFKFKKNQAVLRHHSGKVTINTDVLRGVRDEIAAKLRAHTSEFVAGLDI